MCESEQRFAQLLTEALHEIKRREKKSIQKIQEEMSNALGREGVTAIEYWRLRKKAPAKRSDLEGLARLIHARLQPGREWLEEFLQSGCHPNPESVLSDLLLPNPQLPPKPYQKLIGRSKEIKQLQEALRDIQGFGVIGIDGMGGIGKTALAREVAEWSLIEQLFENLIWIGDVDGKLKFEDIVNTLGSRLLNQPDFASLQWTQRVDRVKALLQRKRKLIVLDNLDTAESQKDIITQLQPLLTLSKAILTGRHRFERDIYKEDIHTLHLKGLDKDASLDFIHQHAKIIGLTVISEASPGELEEINKCVEGSPLALRLVVSQLEHLPLPDVLDQLRNIPQSSSESDEDEYTRFFKFIFWRSWEYLTKDSQRLAIVLAHFASGIGGDFSEIKKVMDDVPENRLRDSISRLWRSSFLEIGEHPNLTGIRYYLHPLTKYFVESDLVKIDMLQEN